MLVTHERTRNRNLPSLPPLKGGGGVPAAVASAAARRRPRVRHASPARSPPRRQRAAHRGALGGPRRDRKPALSGERTHLLARSLRAGQRLASHTFASFFCRIRMWVGCIWRACLVLGGCLCWVVGFARTRAGWAGGPAIVGRQRRGCAAEGVGRRGGGRRVPGRETVNLRRRQRARAGLVGAPTARKRAWRPAPEARIIEMAVEAKWRLVRLSFSCDYTATF
jgi:hypothetical protein